MTAVAFEAAVKTETAAGRVTCMVLVMMFEINVKSDYKIANRNQVKNSVCDTGLPTGDNSDYKIANMETETSTQTTCFCFNRDAWGERYRSQD